MATLVTVRGLKAYYEARVAGRTRSVRAVDGVTLDIDDNEVLGIAGESGSGKTTLLRVLVGMVRPPLLVRGGSVLYQVDGTQMDPLRLNQDALNSIRWRFMSYIPQGSMNVLNPTRTIEKTFLDVLAAHRQLTDGARARAAIREHLKALGLPGEVLRSFPHQLSGGMRQRVTIALATILRPRVILADEATTALDVVVQRGVLQLLKRLQREYRNALVIVTHDMAVHALMAHRVAIMYAGRIVEVGPTDQVFREPRHPYTRYLIGSIPRVGDKTVRWSAPGSPPSLVNPPPGCAFHPRCKLAMDRCVREVPPLRKVGAGQVACFLFEDSASGGGPGESGLRGGD